MEADREICTKVMDYMNSVTEEWLQSSESGNINSAGARFSFKKWATDLNLMKDNARFRMDDVIIECPFHKDESPSLLFNDVKHVYHCFSCGSHGNIINFLTEYDKNIKGFGINYYQKLNEIVINDVQLRATLGIDSVYRGRKKLGEELPKPFKFVKSYTDFRPSSYLELSSWMCKNKCSLNEIEFFILSMQAGIEPIVIYRELCKTKSIDVSEETEVIDLDELMEEDNGDS